MKKFYDKYSWLIIILLLALVVFKCGNEPKKPEPVNIPEIKQQDSFRTIIKHKDSVRVKEVLKWRNMTHITDSVKCYTEIIPFIAQCDTIILHDSILIGTMDKALDLDSTIQNKLINRISQDSAKIVKLEKKVKRNRKLALEGWTIAVLEALGYSFAEKIKP